MLVTERCWLSSAGANLPQGCNTDNMQKKKMKIHSTQLFTLQK